MKLEQNGRKSCGQKSRHIDIRYFFMKDRVETEGIKIVYCPTEQMLADFFTKPLQGALFNKFKRVLMGQAHIDTLSLSPPAPTEERVEESAETIVDKRNTVEAEKITDEKTGIVESHMSDVTNEETGGDWTTVQNHTKKIRFRSDPRGPLNQEAKKPMRNNIVENERSSHSLV